MSRIVTCDACHAAQSRGRVVKSIVLIMRLHLRNMNSNYPAGLRDAELVTVTQCDEDIYRIYAE